MTQAGLSGAQLSQGVVWTTAAGRVDKRRGTALAHAALLCADQYLNNMLLFDFRRTVFAGGFQSLQLLVNALGVLADRLEIRIALLGRQGPELQYAQRALLLRGYDCASFAQWQRAMHWLNRPHQQVFPAADQQPLWTGAAKSTAFNAAPQSLQRQLQAFARSRIGLPRARVERELAHLMDYVKQLAADHGVNAVRGVAKRAAAKKQRSVQRRRTGVRAPRRTRLR